MKTIKIRWTRHAGYYWSSRDKLIGDVLLWIPSHGGAKAGRPAQTYIQQLCADTGCNPEDLPEAMDDREGWWERESGISMLIVWHDDDDDVLLVVILFFLIRSMTRHNMFDFFVWMPSLIFCCLFSFDFVNKSKTLRDIWRKYSIRNEKRVTAKEKAEREKINRQSISTNLS